MFVGLCIKSMVARIFLANHGCLWACDAGGLATLAKLNQPSGVAASHTNVYISDTNTRRVRVYNRINKTINAFAGSGFTNPANPGDGKSFLTILAALHQVAWHTLAN